MTVSTDLGQKVVDVIAWQQAIASEHGPANYTIRLILLALAVNLQVDSRFTTATRLRITHREIADATGLGRTWVMRQVREAERLGWISISRPLKTDRKRMPACEYTIRLPDVPRESKRPHHAQPHPFARPYKEMR